MLKSMRGAAGSWIAKIFIGLLVASFAVWGIGDIFISRNDGAIATVGDREIDVARFNLALRNQISGLERQVGRPLSIEEARMLGADQAAIVDLARQEAMFAEANDFAVSASDIEIKLSIALNPAFHNAMGEFDPAQYRQTLDFSGVSPAEYEAGQRRALASTLVAGMAANGYSLPSGMAERLHRFNNETRRFHYVTLGAEAAGEIPEADDAALQAHLEANAEDFSAPEFRVARYVIASPDALAAQMSATEAEAREIYEIRKAFYNSPETREVRQIVYKTAEEAEAAKARIAEGASFADLAAEKDLSLADAYIGNGPAESFGAAAAEAAFAESDPGIVGPVETDFGPALLQIASITPGEAKTFDDVREELMATVRRDKALDEILRIETEISDFVAGGADLDLIARNMGLEVKETPALDDGGASPDGAVESAMTDPVFTSTLFGAEKDFVAGPVSLENDSIVVLSATEITPPALRPLDQVRQAVAESLRAEQISTALATLADAIADRVNQGELLAVEADTFGKVLSASEAMTRSGATPDLTTTLVRDLFEQDAGGAAWSPLGDGQRVAIAQVFEINDPEGEEAELEKAALARQIDMIAQSDVREMLIRASVEDRGVSVNNLVVEQALANIGGYAR